MARYIDAEKFLKHETKRCGSVPSIGSCTTDSDSLAYVLAKTPTADVEEVRHGEWVRYWDDNYLSWCHKCSECGNFPLTKDETMHDEVLSAYCPHCGARMGGKNVKKQIWWSLQCYKPRYKNSQYELQILTDTDGEPYMVIAKGNHARHLVELMAKDEAGTATERSDI